MQDLSGTKDEWSQCNDCGTSPIGHRTAWVNNSMDVLTATRSKTNGLKQKIERFFSPLLGVFGLIIVGFLRIFWIMRYCEDVEKSCTLRSRVVWEEARARKIPMRMLMFLGKPTELFEAEVHGRRIMFHSLPIPERLERSVSWADDKIIFKEKMIARGVPVPESISVTSAEEAVEAQKKIGAPVCIKPRSSSRARHTSTYVVTDEDVRDAFRRAQQLCHWVSVEKNLDGEVCRATCVGGKLVGFLQSRSPVVTGDGKQTVQQLIDQANKEKPERVHDIVMSPVHIRSIRRRGYMLESVLEAGKKLPLTHWRGRLFGGRTREMPKAVHPELRRLIELAADETQLPVVGFDLLIDDPEKDPREQNWGIVEANSLPYIDLHYWPYEGEPTNVAAYVWDLWSERKIDTK